QICTSCGCERCAPFVKYPDRNIAGGALVHLRSLNNPGPKECEEQEKDRSRSAEALDGKMEGQGRSSHDGDYLNGHAFGHYKINPPENHVQSPKWGMWASVTG